MSKDFPVKPPHPSTLENIDLSKLDARLVLDKASQRWLFEDGDQEYEYDYIKDQWINTSKRSLSEDLLNKEDIKRQRKQDMSKLKEELNSLKQKKKNSSIFISNLPIDSRFSEIEETFAKYGKISVGKDEKSRIKMYTNEKGSFKGEALIIYSNPESALLAIEMMDNTEYNGNTIRVEEAKFDNNNNNKKEHLKKNSSKTVVIRNMVRKEELANDIHIKQDIIDDIKEECKNIGVFDIEDIAFNEEDATILVRFSKQELLLLCIKKFHNRYYDGLTLDVQESKVIMR